MKKNTVGFLINMIKHIGWYQVEWIWLRGALLRFVHSGNEFLYGKIVWSAFHGGFKSEYLQLQNPYNNSTDGIV